MKLSLWRSLDPEGAAHRHFQVDDLPGGKKKQMVPAQTRGTGPGRSWNHLLVALLVLSSAPIHAQPATLGVAKNAIGVLLVTRSDGTQERLQGKGTLPLYEADELKTGTGSQALVELHDGTRIALNEHTTFVIRARRQQEGGIIRILKILFGEVWVKTSAKPHPLEIETPVSYAGIKGTELNMKVLSDGRSELTVVKGIVELANAFGTCSVMTGTQSVGERGKRCTPPAPADVRSVVAWTKNIVPLYDPRSDPGMGEEAPDISGATREEQRFEMEAPVGVRQPVPGTAGQPQPQPPTYAAPDQPQPGGVPPGSVQPPYLGYPPYCPPCITVTPTTTLPPSTTTTTTRRDTTTTTTLPKWRWPVEPRPGKPLLPVPPVIKPMAPKPPAPPPSKPTQQQIK